MNTRKWECSRLPLQNAAFLRWFAERWGGHVNTLTIARNLLGLCRSHTIKDPSGGKVVDASHHTKLTLSILDEAVGLMRATGLAAIATRMACTE